MQYKLQTNIGNNFCYAPWTNIHINTSGAYKICCAGTETIGDLRINSIQDLIQNKKIIEIKKSIIDNQLHQNCQICYRQEKHSSVSERSWYNNIADNLPITIDSIEQSVLQNLDIRWSNTCNLSCVYCDHEASSQWASLKKQPLERQDFENTLPDILKFIDANRKTIKNLALLGGEPLLQKENIDLLDVIDDNVHINVITNLSVPLNNNKVFQKLISKKNVMWDISFETVEDKFEYVRHGSNWNLVRDNITYLQNATEYTPGQLIGITSQYSIYNAMNLSQLHEYFADNNFPKMRWNELHYPNVLSVASLPQRFLNKAIDELKKSVQYHYSPVQEKFLLDMALSLQKVKSTVDNCDSLFNWHHDQEQTYWPNFPLKFANLWSEYK